MQNSSEYLIALDDFNNGNFQDAVHTFKKLLDQFPKDPYYQYYYGGCMVSLGKTNKEIIAYLKHASLKDVPKEVLFFTARALHLHYQFDEAIQYYQQYLENFSAFKKPRFPARLFIQQCQFASTKLTNQPNANIQEIQPVSKEELLQTLNNAREGFVEIPVTQWTENSSENLEQTIIFLPTIASGSNKAFVSGRDEQENMDIFQVSRISGINWSSERKPVPALNSIHDDGHAIFDRKNNTLYFSSNRPGGMGGFDIFFSKYNSTTNSWTTPENMGYPVNTPADELVFVPLSKPGSFLLVSNRGTGSGKWSAIQIQSPPAKQPGNSLPVLDHLAYASTPIKEKPNNSATPDETEMVKDNYQAKIDYFSKENPLEKTIEYALFFQLKSDSFQTLVLRDKSKLKTTTGKARNLLFRAIKVHDEQMKKNQEHADRLYLVAREKEIQQYAEKVNKEKAREPVNLVLFPGNQKETADENMEDEPVHAFNELIDQFKIHATTPYSENNPIPLDLQPLEGVIYKIQLGAFSKEITWDKFGGLSPVTGEQLADRGITKYYVGLFSSSEMARSALKEVRQAGFEEAFLVSFVDGKKVSIARAIELEKIIN